MWVTHTLSISLHTYIRVAMDRDGVEIKGIIDQVLVKKDIMCYEEDVSAVRGMDGGLSDHHVALF